jgi:hypothetical protein
MLRCNMERPDRESRARRHRKAAAPHGLLPRPWAKRLCRRPISALAWARPAVFGSRSWERRLMEAGGKFVRQYAPIILRPDSLVGTSLLGCPGRGRCGWSEATNRLRRGFKVWNLATRHPDRANFAFAQRRNGAAPRGHISIGRHWPLDVNGRDCDALNEDHATCRACVLQGRPGNPAHDAPG